MNVLVVNDTSVLSKPLLCLHEELSGSCDSSSNTNSSGSGGSNGINCPAF